MRVAALTMIGASLLAQGWRKSDTYWQLAVTGAYACDYLQTAELQKRPGQHEINRLLGQRPTRATINQHFAAAVLANAAVAYALPIRYRRTWQVSSLAFEAYWVRRNVVEARLAIRW